MKLPGLDAMQTVVKNYTRREHEIQSRKWGIKEMSN